MPNDYPIEEMLPHIQELVLGGALVFLKWTCPKCGERCTADVPNEFCTQGYVHGKKADGTECGHLYLGNMFDYLVVMQVTNDLPERGEMN